VYQPDRLIDLNLVPYFLNLVIDLLIVRACLVGWGTTITPITIDHRREGAYLRIWMDRQTLTP